MQAGSLLKAFTGSKVVSLYSSISTSAMVRTLHLLLCCILHKDTWMMCYFLPCLRNITWQGSAVVPKISTAASIQCNSKTSNVILIYHIVQKSNILHAIYNIIIQLIITQLIWLNISRNYQVSHILATIWPPVLLILASRATLTL